MKLHFGSYSHPKEESLGYSKQGILGSAISDEINT